MSLVQEDIYTKLQKNLHNQNLKGSGFMVALMQLFQSLSNSHIDMSTCLAQSKKVEISQAKKPFVKRHTYMPTCVLNLQFAIAQKLNQINMSN